MKKVLHSTLATLIIIAAASCQSLKIIPGSELQQNPCKIDSSALNIRLHNVGRKTISKVELRISGKTYVFAGMKPDAFSCFKVVPPIWTNNERTVWLISRDGKKQYGATQVPVDHIGETRYDKGFFTINVAVTGKMNRPRIKTFQLVEE